MERAESFTQVEVRTVEDFVEMQQLDDAHHAQGGRDVDVVQMRLGEIRIRDESIEKLGDRPQPTTMTTMGEVCERGPRQGDNDFDPIALIRVAQFQPKETHP